MFSLTQDLSADIRNKFATWALPNQARTYHLISGFGLLQLTVVIFDFSHVL